MTIKNKAITFALTGVLTISTLGLAACGGGSASSSSEQTQDNCYGDDLPEINLDSSEN